MVFYEHTIYDPVKGLNMKKHQQNQQGFSHHFILPVLAFIAVGAIGAYLISISHAATAGPSDVVYRQLSSNATTNGFYRYSAAGTTKYDTTSWNSNDILDVSQDQNWVLTIGAGDKLTALSKDGQTVVYPYAYTTQAVPARYITSRSYACTSAVETARSALFSKASGATTPKLYVALESIPCENLALNFSKITHRFFGVDTSSTKTALTENLTSDSDFSWVKSTATNGYALLDINHQFRVVSPAGKTVFKAASSVYGMYMSENGKKLVYEKNGKNYFYLANSNGKSAKSILSNNYKTTHRFLAGISPNGAYVIFNSQIAKGTTWTLNSYTVSSKKVKTLDTGYSEGGTAINGAVYGEKWLPASNTIVYAKQDVKGKTSQILQVAATGSAKKVLVSASYDTSTSFNIY